MGTAMGMSASAMGLGFTAPVFLCAVNRRLSPSILAARHHTSILRYSHPTLTKTARWRKSKMAAVGRFRDVTVNRRMFSGSPATESNTKSGNIGRRGLASYGRQMAQAGNLLKSKSLNRHRMPFPAKAKVAQNRLIPLPHFRVGATSLS